MQNQLFLTFGLPGAGKTYVAHVFEEFGFFFHDGDDDLTEAMKIAIATQSPIDDTLRDAFFENIVHSIEHLRLQTPRLVVAQTFIKEKYRRRVLDHFPEARFVLVQADAVIRERRLTHRTHQALDLDYARRMTTIFEPPLILHNLILNNSDGRDHLRQQILALLTT